MNQLSNKIDANDRTIYDVLNERKAALISVTVIGKIDVRGFDNV